MLRRQVPIGILSMPPVLAGGGIKVNPWYISDDFTTDDAAPLGTPRTAEPTGQWAVVENDGQLSISGGELALPDQTTAALGDLMLVSGALTRAAGMAMVTNLDITETGGCVPCGFVNNAAASAVAQFDNVIYSGSSVEMRPYQGAVTSAITVANHTGTYRSYAVVLRSAGAFYIRDGQLMFVGATANTATVYANIQAFAAVSSVKYSRIGQLGGPWLDAYGPGALHTSGAVPAATSFTHEKNFLAFFTLTNRGSAGNTVFKFRKQDADNYWQLTIASDGSADLSEVVATVVTSRGTAAAGAFGNGERCYISCGFSNDQKIAISDSAQERINYTSAANFATATAGELTSLATDAVVSNLEIYPVDLSGAALAWINALEAG